MAKEAYWTVRVAEWLDNKAKQEAARRGMSVSEFIRYAVAVFFDHGDDSNNQTDNSTVEEAS